MVEQDWTHDGDDDDDYDDDDRRYHTNETMWRCYHDTEEAPKKTRGNRRVKKKSRGEGKLTRATGVKFCNVGYRLRLRCLARADRVACIITAARSQKKEGIAGLKRRRGRVLLELDAVQLKHMPSMRFGFRGYIGICHAKLKLLNFFKYRGSTLTLQRALVATKLSRKVRVLPARSLRVLCGDRPLCPRIGAGLRQHRACVRFGCIGHVWVRERGSVPAQDAVVVLLDRR